MPMPESVTTISAQVAARRIASRDAPPAGVNLMAFDSRFHSTCCRRGPSAWKRADDRRDVHVDANALRVGG